VREIEVKVRVSDGLNPIIATLTAKGVIVADPVTHHDRVYGLPGVPGASENSEPWLRIRTETKGGVATSYLTLKKSVTNQLDSIEHETIIDDESEMEHIIEHVGFVPYSDLTKTRRKAHMGDIELCLDVVGPLGAFVEAEKLTGDDADYDAVVEELWGILEPLGLSRTDTVTDGYDVLMNKHLGKE